MNIDPPPKFSLDDGDIDDQSPLTVRERVVAEARRTFGLKPRKELRDAGDQADQSAAEDRRTMDVAKVLRQLHNPDDALVRKALRRLHVRWWHAVTE